MHKICATNNKGKQMYYGISSAPWPLLQIFIKITVLKIMTNLQYCKAINYDVGSGLIRNQDEIIICFKRIRYKGAFTNLLIIIMQVVLVLEKNMTILHIVCLKINYVE